MKVEVIKGVSHSIELNFGETSVCITPDEAENLIAQLRAVVPVPGDVQEAAEKYNEMMSWAWEAPNHPHKAAFIAGAEWERNKTIPADVQEAADWYIGHRAEVGEDSETFAKRKAFADGMLAERWRVNRKAEVPEDYDPKYDKEALDAANEYVKGKQNLTYGAFRLMRPAFADGWMEHKERLMKDAVGCEIGWSDGYRIAPADENSMNEALAKIGVLDQVGAGVDAKVSVIIIKKEK